MLPLYEICLLHSPYLKLYVELLRAGPHPEPWHRVQHQGAQVHAHGTVGQATGDDGGVVVDVAPLAGDRHAFAVHRALASVEVKHVLRGRKPVKGFSL